MRLGPRGLRGFTLLELLVVVLLIGLLTSFAVLGIQGRSASELQREEARRLLQRMSLAREEAVLTASSLGIRFAPDGYLFLALRDGRWRIMDADRMFATHELPREMRLEVDIDGLEVDLGARGDDEDADDEEDDSSRPQVFFLPGGEIVPGFRIVVLSEETDIEYRLAPGDETWLELSRHEF